MFAHIAHGFSLGSAQSGVQAVDHAAAILRRHSGHPILERAVHQLAGRAELLQLHKPAARNLPLVHIMLIDTHAAAFHDGEGLLMLQQHAHHRGARQIGAHAGQDARKARLAEHLLGEAWAVKIAHTQDALLHLGRTEGRGVHSQVASLAVAAQVDAALRALRHIAQIAHRVQLRGHDGGKGHIEILFPAHQRAVRAAEGDGRAAVGQMQRQRGKLLLPHGIKDVLIPIQQDIGITRRLQQLRQKLLILLAAGTGSVGHLHAGQYLPCGHVQRHALFSNAVKGHIAQARENQRVHIAQRHGGQGQIAPPGKIIQQVGHSVPLLGTKRNFSAIIAYPRKKRKRRPLASGPPPPI